MRVVVVGILAIAAPAGAQSLNVSFGHTSGAPSASYAAAGDAGAWNAVTGVAGQTFDLVDTTGAPSGVTVSQSPTTTVITSGDPSITGDDGNLLNSGLVTSGAETCLMFSNVEPGDYEVLIYAWQPGDLLSRTRQDEAPSTIDVGGAWTGQHVEGITYARYPVTVGADGALPAHSGLMPGAPSATLNGVQIRPASGGGSGSGSGSGSGAGSGSGSDPNNPPPQDAGCQVGGGSAGLGVAFAIVALARRRRVTS